jgi:Uma2 family endonuclease
MSSLTDLATLDTSDGFIDDIIDEGIVAPPTDLWSDEPPLETDLHLQQIILFLDCLNWWWRDRQDFYASANLTIYFNQKKIKKRDFRGPDFFVVLGTERKARKSWVVWDEDGKYPNVIIEVLSKSTASVDKGLKKQLYQDVFRTPDYFWFDPETLDFAGFHLVDGNYQPLELTEQGWLWSQQLDLFLGIHENKLRFFDPEGRLVLTEAEDQRLQKEQLELQKERLAEKLRELGVDPADL